MVEDISPKSHSSSGSKDGKIKKRESLNYRNELNQKNQNLSSIQVHLFDTLKHDDGLKDQQTISPRFEQDDHLEEEERDLNNEESKFNEDDTSSD